MYGFYTGHPGGLEGVSDSAINLYDVINDAEKVIKLAKEKTQTDISIREFSIRSVGADNRIRFNEGTWMKLTDGEYLSLTDVGNMKIELQTDGIDFELGYSF